MSMPLWTRATPARSDFKSCVGRVTQLGPQEASPSDSVLVTEAVDRSQLDAGWVAVLTTDKPDAATDSLYRAAPTPVFHSAPSLAHLAEGDVVAADPGGTIRTLFRKNSPHNTLVATEACNSFCTMCSQPPKRVDPRMRMPELLRLLELIDPQTPELGVSGGEPTLLKGDLVRLVRRAKELLPATALHLLTNGRLFYYGRFAHDLGEVQHHDLMLGIPLYSDVDFIHDFVVQSRGAHAQTIAGIHNLERFGTRVEVRIVIHQQTFDRLPNLAEFICRNLPFVAQVSLMGLEPTGFAVGNIRSLYIDPFHYRRELFEATKILANFGLTVYIFNHQLCTVPEVLWPYCVKSISDWKNDYLPECSDCDVRNACGGFFSSTLHSSYRPNIFPINRGGDI